MAFSLSFTPNINYATAPGSSSAWIRCNARNTNSGTVTTMLNDLLRGIYSPLYNDNVNQGWRASFAANVRGIGVGGCDYNNGISTWTPNLRSTLNIDFSTQNEVDEFNNLLANHTLVIKIIGKANIDGVLYPYPFFYFKKFIAPVNGDINLISDTCLNEFPDIQPVIYNAQNSDILDSSNNTLTFEFDASEDCTDLRSSSSTSEFLITLNGRDVELNQKSVHYNLLIQPDSTHTEGTINLSSTDGLYTSFYKYDGASVRMLDGTCCHGVGHVDIYGDVQIVGWGINEVSDVLIPVPRTLSRQNVLLLRANFDDECCCYSTGYSEEISDLINDFMAGYSSYDGRTEILSAITPKSITWRGFRRLVDFCCDDSDCTQIDDYDYRIEIPEPSQGGGDNVDITCICDNLALINNTLSAFRADNKTALDGINGALSHLNIDIDNQCICDNLEAVKGSLDDIKTSIDDKELTVTNSPQIHVAPCQPIVTNPINNITVTPSTAEITTPINVTPCQPIVTNPINNITVTPSTADVNVNFDNSGIESALSDINSNLSVRNDGLICDDKGLACIVKEALNTSGIASESITDVLKNALNTSDDNSEGISDVLKNALNTSDDNSEGISDVIKNKDMGSNIDVEVSPADDVNINRVYYTNQRNGDTNI